MEIVNLILEVFLVVAGWLGTAFEALIPVFYIAPVGDTPGQLTFLGALCSMGLALGVGFLLLRVIQNFIRFRS